MNDNERMLRDKLENAERENARLNGVLKHLIVKTEMQREEIIKRQLKRIKTEMVGKNE